MFRQPFGATGYLDGEGKGGDDSRAEGVQARGTLGGAAVMALPFLLLGEVGVEMALAYFALATLPVKPFPGRGLWRWSKAAWGALAAVSLTTYYLHEVGSLPEGAVLVAGAMGASSWPGPGGSRRGPRPPGFPGRETFIRGLFLCAPTP